MKIKQIKGYSVLSEMARQQLESVFYPTIESASRELQQVLPNHLVVAEQGRISVFVKDRSFNVAQFEPVREERKKSSEHFIRLENLL